MDDFGTGYTAISSIRALPFDIIKIDKDFVSDIETSEYSKAFVRTMVQLGKTINADICVEGIETKEQATLLTKLGCNMAQGFFFARPMPVPDYEKLAYGIGA